ncbi:iron uptake transporter permease EfeU [Corynebacterium lowii]|uniref:Ferrous iron permease EfeU n=1 Tax=Corynebacterium lowii TaxID=1544413 RepID=A0A0Q1AKF9_9CORY|nr:iron uptake transporter permease EfeU [Corynebacterium lowii]KQB87435.1 Ferrous iron permease EfeU [Corynebacterium lowii]MDP9851973.1 high-affinity iron transporter [Corynebacterium lowii]
MFLANFLIALREGVEASLIVGILVASLVKMDRRDVLPRLWLGVALAAFVPLLAGALMTWGPYTLTFQAQEILGGLLSLVAVAMITGMVLWMSQNSRELSKSLNEQTATALNNSSGWGIVWIAVISVGREGLETAIFVWATVRATADGGLWQPTLGVISGLLVAVLIGWLVYRGTARINLGRFFTLTGYLLIVVAAGIVSYGLGDLQEAGVIPGWGVSAYDLSPYFDGHIPGVHPGAWWFVLAEAMFNVNLAPTVVQVVGWVSYLLIVLPLFWWQQHRSQGSAARKNGAVNSATNNAPSNSTASNSAVTKAAPAAKERS